MALTAPIAPPDFRKHGYAYRLIEQKGNVALYEARTALGGYPRSFEVHIVRQSGERIINGRTVAAGPQLASAEQFGRLAWSYTNKQEALLKFIALARGARGNHAEGVE